MSQFILDEQLDMQVVLPRIRRLASAQLLAFRPERRSSAIGPKVRRMIERNSRRACIQLERLDREYRKRQADRDGGD